MDLKIASGSANTEERQAVDSLLGAPQETSHGAQRDEMGMRVSTGGESLRKLRHLLLPTLHSVNDRIGYISRGAINYISQRLDIAPAEIYGVATFYALFDTNERPARQVHVCVDLACRAASGCTEENL
ncbi:MAG: NAD(P)H-dependent oxidoreductase subunit E, partial [Acidimicrobiaceae bacterium]